jgi:hypothetical protein
MQRQRGAEVSISDSTASQYLAHGEQLKETMALLINVALVMVRLRFLPSSPIHHSAELRLRLNQVLKYDPSCSLAESSPSASARGQAG